MPRAVGLDIGSRMIKLVELGGTAKSPRVQRLVVRELPPPPPPPAEGEVPGDQDQEISRAIREVFDELKLPRDDVCAAFDSGVTIFREISVPFTDDDQIRRVVRFEAENHLHSHSIEDVVVNWVRTSTSRDGSRLTIFASPKAELARLLKILKGAGIEPASVDLDATAVFTACQTTAVFEQRPNAILLDVGARSTSLILVVEGRPVVLRSFLLGTEQISSQLSKELDVSRDEARQRALHVAGPRPDDLFVPAVELTPPTAEGEKSLAQLEGDVVADKRAEFVRKLHRESIRSLASLQEGASPECILLTGGGSLLPGLAEALSERFELPVERIDLTSRIPWKDEGTNPAFTAASTPAAVGCALRMFGQDPLGIELLRDEFAPTNLFDVVKTALATTVTLLFLVLLGLAFMAKERRDAERKAYNYAAYRAESIFRRAEREYLQKVEDETEEGARAKIAAWLRSLPNDQTRADRYRNQLSRRYRDLESALGLARDIVPVPSALEVWLEIIRALNGRPRQEYGYLRILKMDIGARNATVRIEVEDQAVFDKIREQFESSEYFKGRARSGRVVDVGPANFRNNMWQRDYDFRFKEED